MLQQTLAASEKTLGSDHPDTLTSVCCLAFLFHSQKKYDDASMLYQRAFAGYRSIFRLEHPIIEECFKHPFPLGE